jgi:hypothetical protein
MSRTRRKVPHWINGPEKGAGEHTRVPDPKYLRVSSRRSREDVSDRIRSGLFNMSDRERSEDIERRRKLKREDEERLMKIEMDSL